MNAKTKDIKIGEHSYRVRKMDARTGSWVATQLLTKMLPGIASKMVEGMIDRPLPPGRAEMTEGEFHNLQEHCLRVVDRYDSNGPHTVPMPIVGDGGVWAFRELEDDALTVLTLTVHALLFTVMPFFSGDGLSAVLSSFSDLKPLAPSK